MKPIYNRFGRTIAWINDDYIYDLTGKKVLAFLKEDVVFSYTGKYLGIFKYNFFRDPRGHSVAFVKGASRGPALPKRRISPNPPMPAAPPIPRIIEIPPHPPIYTKSWSNLTWDKFLNTPVLLCKEIESQ